jgi:hypothetical protein
MGEIRVKGTVLSGLVRASGAHQAGTLRARLLQAVAGDLRVAIETNSLMPTVWYPVGFYRALLAFIGWEDPARLEGVIRGATRDTVGVIHRALMRVFSPDTLISRSARIFGTYFEGEMESHLRSSGFAMVRWSSCHGFDGNCWAAQLHTLSELIAMAGVARCGRAVVEGGRDGDSGMLVEVHWGETQQTVPPGAA